MSGEAATRISCFAGIFVLVALAEYFWPRRPLTTPKRSRWFCNLSIVVMDTAILRLATPLMPVGVAEVAHINDWGLFRVFGLPTWLELLLGFLLLDLIIYLQHRAFHRVPLFWRFHRVHHTDLDLDVSSGNRFHPIEMLVSLLIKAGVVVMAGIPATAVLLFEVVLNATSLFNHGNLRIPIAIDRRLRRVLVTPDMHRVHHSVIPGETDSNFSFNFPWWDRLLGTYRDQPAAGHAAMTIGLKEFRDHRRLGLGYLLALPFCGPNG